MSSLHDEYEAEAREVRQMICDVRRGDLAAHIKGMALLGRFVDAARSGRKLRDEFLADLLQAVERHIERVQFEHVGRQGMN